MKPNQLDRIMRLVRRTRDRFVVLDKDTDEAFVLMNLSEYEQLLNGTDPIESLPEEEMLQKINNDIARWREQNQKFKDEETDEELEYKNTEKIAEISENNEEPHLEPIVEKEEVFTPNLPVEIQSLELEDDESEPLSEEDLSDIPEEEEQKFHVEPVE